jgi:hypothetical protein
MPEPKFATNSVNPTITNMGAHARPATNVNAVSIFGNASEAGQIICAAYTWSADSMPITRVVKTVASRMLRRGFSASSDNVEIPSKPIYVSTAIEVPPSTAFAFHNEGS